MQNTRDPSDEVKNYFRFLPRCLSYAEESCVDNFSVSGDFVHNPRLGRNILNSSNYRDLFKRSMSSCFSNFNSTQDAGTSTSHETERQTSITESEGSEPVAASDMTSEEGVFVNMMDDLESLDTPNGRSLCSDDFSVDSINSPDENDLEKTYEGRSASLEYAVTEVMAKVKIGNTEAQEGHRRTPELRLVIPSDGKEASCASDFGSQRSILDFVSSDSPLYEDREFNFSKSELRKSSSLKYKKTPPGTPSRKKVVRFADAMGLDLESVRHVLNTDSPPKIPASAMADLKDGVEEDRKSIGSRYLTSNFTQPGARDDFCQRVLVQKVCLENAIIIDLTITGVVRVANVGFHKCVRIRYSTNNWHTFHDIMASYIQGSCDRMTDRFSFSISAPPTIVPGCSLQFAVSYTVNDTVYWDSNESKNYSYDCYAKTTPTEAEKAWLSFL